MFLRRPGPTEELGQRAALLFLAGGLLLEGVTVDV